MIDIPYSIDARPDTGFRNGQLGMWLFLASEVMLFGGLFSAYALLRAGAPSWPHHVLDLVLGTTNTVLLVVSSLAIAASRRALAAGNWARHRVALASAAVLGAIFLADKFVEYRAHLAAGDGPWTSTFYAIYFTLTGVHALHLVCGLIVMLYFLGPGTRLWRSEPRRFENRIAATGLYWNFVDVVWIVIYVTLYLA